ncbi:putative membrane protein [Mycobacterium kansasii 824]|uniref:Putative membrane protein n=1 Tax=Mycobacterium kansasii TaxID=1768 RepID=A0A1V3X1Z4_MYCKA|nr:putative membrane protein [Mycobacterium kansasii 824]OOK73130.1 putative membrane protein [Mycobacterium kansasii]
MGTTRLRGRAAPMILTGRTGLLALICVLPIALAPGRQGLS